MCQTGVPTGGLLPAITAEGRSVTASSVTHQATSGVLWYATTRSPNDRPSLRVRVPRPRRPRRRAAVSTSHFCRPPPRADHGGGAAGGAEADAGPAAASGSGLPSGGLGSGLGGTGVHDSIADCGVGFADFEDAVGVGDDQQLHLVGAGVGGELQHQRGLVACCTSLDG